MVSSLVPAELSGCTVLGTGTAVPNPGSGYCSGGGVLGLAGLGTLVSSSRCGDGGGAIIGEVMPVALLLIVKEALQENQDKDMSVAKA